MSADQEAVIVITALLLNMDAAGFHRTHPVVVRAREYLVKHGVTFIIHAGQAITCYKCGMTSFNPGDIQNRYCAHCKEFHNHPTN